MDAVLNKSFFEAIFPTILLLFILIHSSKNTILIYLLQTNDTLSDICYITFLLLSISGSCNNSFSASLILTIL